MVRVYLFWFLLSLPGFALMNRFPRSHAKGGDIGAISVAYVISFLLLAPISIVGYWFRLPLWVLSSAIVLFISSAAVDLYITRHQWFPKLPRIDVLFVSGILLLLVFLVYAGIVGPSMKFDADYHLARIRFLYENGLSNADPYLGIDYTRVYHTNIYHAIISAGSRIARVDILGFWFWTSAWGKLVSASGVYLLTYRIFCHRLSAWSATVWFLGLSVFSSRFIYPNQLAPHWLVSTGLAYAVTALSEKKFSFHVYGIGAASFLIGQVHSLYAVFLAILVCPAAIIFFIWNVIFNRKVRFSSNLLLSAGIIVAVSAAAPFVLIYRYELFPKTLSPTENRQTAIIEDEAINAPAIVTPTEGSTTVRKGKPDHWTRRFWYSETGELVFFDETLFGGRRFQIFLLLVCFLVVLFSRDRKRFFVFLIIVAVEMAILLLSPIASYAASMAGEVWVLERILDIVFLTFPVLAIGGLFSFLNRFPSVFVPFFLISCAFSSCIFSHSQFQLYNFEQVRYIGMRLSKELSDMTSYNELRNYRKTRRFFVKSIPRNAVLLAYPEEGRKVAKLHGLRFIAVFRDTAISDLPQRQRDMDLLRKKNINPTILKSLIDKYHIQYVLRTRLEYLWAEHNATLVRSYKNMKIFKINEALRN